MDPVLGPSVGISHLGVSKNGTRFEAAFTSDANFGPTNLFYGCPFVPLRDDLLFIAMCHLVQFRELRQRMCVVLVK